MGNVAEQNDKIADALAAIRAGYLQRLSAELGELNRLAERLLTGDADRALLDELYHRLHQLAGSGGTFGFHLLSETASRLEQIVKQWLTEGFAAGTALTPEQFVAAISSLRETLGLQERETARIGAVMKANGQAEKQLHVWLVEDDVLLGHELAQLLGQFNYEVRLFTRLDDVEAAIECEVPDALIMDVLFQEEGANATEVVQTRPVFRRLDCPIIFISALGDFESRVRAVRLGAAPLTASWWLMTMPPWRNTIEWYWPLLAWRLNPSVRRHR
jgi:HPt (histidine-containing phosphotransfer) domain-containing protein